MRIDPQEKIDWRKLSNKGSGTADDFARRWQQQIKEDAGRTIQSRKPWPPVQK